MLLETFNDQAKAEIFKLELVSECTGVLEKLESESMEYSQA
jgi:hypothetical protein